MVVSRTTEEEVTLNPIELNNRLHYLKEQMRIHEYHYNHYLELKEEFDALNSVK